MVYRSSSDTLPPPRCLLFPIPPAPPIIPSSIYAQLHLLSHSLPCSKQQEEEASTPSLLSSFPPSILLVMKPHLVMCGQYSHFGPQGSLLMVVGYVVLGIEPWPPAGRACAPVQRTSSQDWKFFDSALLSVFGIPHTQGSHYW